MNHSTPQADPLPDPDSADWSTCGAARSFRYTLVAIALIGLALQVLALGPLRDPMWGFHLYAFLPPAAAAFAWIATLAAIAWLLLAGASAGAGASARPGGRPGAPFLRRLSDHIEGRPQVTFLLLAVGCGSLYWLLRSEQNLLGDGWALIEGLTRGKFVHEREPLAVLAQYRLYWIFSRLVENTSRPLIDVAWDAVAVGSVVSGVLFALVASSLGRSFLCGEPTSPPGKSRALSGIVMLLVAMTLLAQGYCQLFFGYLENYAYYALLVAFYLWCGMECLRARLPLIVPIIVAIVSIGVHFSAVLLLPSLGCLVACVMVQGKRRIGVARDLVLGAGSAVLLGWLLSPMLAGQSLVSAAADIVALARADQGGGAGWSYMWSWPHIRDFLNEHYLTGPMAAWLLVPALGILVAQRRRPGPQGIFLIVCASTYLVGCWVASEPTMGYARDWDIFAPASVTFTVAGLHTLVSLVQRNSLRVRLLSFALLVSALHLGAWVGVNHSEHRSLARVETLPLSRGRREVTVGNWHLRNGDSVTASDWFRRALAVDPDNVNALYLLGQIYLKAGDADQAAAAFGKAVSVRPDKLEFRTTLVQALLAAGHKQEALRESRRLCDRHPGRYNSWLTLGTALAHLERGDEALAAFAHADSLADEQWRRSDLDYDLALHRGLILAKLGERRRAAEFFARALELRPQSDAAAINLILMLMADERTEEARPYLESFARNHPEDPMHEQVVRWLAEMEGAP